MGGEREKTISAPTKGQVINLMSGAIRIHENQGEVHFHDDRAKLKVAVPVAQFWNAWEQSRGSLTTIRLFDPKNSTCAIIKTDMAEVKKEWRLWTSVQVIKITIDPSYAQINDFAEGR